MKRIAALMLAMAIAVSAFAGCQTQPDDTDPTASPVAEATTGSTAETSPLETQPSADDVVISEAMSDNKYLVLGHALDWVELYNREETPVRLDGYALADHPQDTDRLYLDGLEIPAGGYLVVPLEENAPFHLSSDGDTVYLIQGMQVVSQLALPFCEGGESFGQTGACTWVTPGYANTEEGYLASLEAMVLPSLSISEVMSSNSGYAPVGGEYYDWVEVRNGSELPVSLLGYTLSDKRSEPERYAFPDVTLQPGEAFLVYCSDDPSLGDSHAPFKLSASGEAVYLSRQGILTDALNIPGDLQHNQSYGRSGNLPVYMDTPTPGADNTSGYRVSVEAPQADLPSGIYEDAVAVTLSAEGTIYYTTDGSRPTTDSRVYTEPISVTGVTTVRAFCVSGERTSPITAYTYLVGVEHDLPVVSVAIPQDSLTGSTGVLNNIYYDYEHEAVLTLLEDGEEKFSVPFGFRLHGNDSRKGEKQSFQLRFRSEYGASTLQYPLFEDLQIGEFNSLLLKGGSEDWPTAMMRDEMATSIVTGSTNLYTQAMKPCVLYLGGEYWGIYYFRERFSDDYVASHLNVSADSVDLLEYSAADVQAGSNEDFLALRAYVLQHDMSLPENYAYLAQQIDVLSLMDWYICRTYMGDRDLGNIRRFRSSESDGKWRWMFFDLDWSFYHKDDQPLTNLGPNYMSENILFRALLKSDEGRDTFLKRYAELMGTVLNEEYINSVIDSILIDIESEIPRDRARWSRSLTGWENAVLKLRNYVNDGVRTKWILKHLQEYFGLKDTEMEYYFGNLYRDLLG